MNVPALPVAAATILHAAVAVAGTFDDLDILPGFLFSGGPAKDGIPAMTNPEIVAPGQITFLREQDLVLGVVVEGEARAYPENLGWLHEIINDRFGARSISVTLCPLTGTGLVFDATDADGSQIEFGVSGLLLNSNLVMFDRRDGETLYPQMIFTGISGRFEGQRLKLLPVVETTWQMWKRMHPDTGVAQAGTGLQRYTKEKRGRYANPRRYEFYPYDDIDFGDYRTSNDFLFTLTFTSGLIDRTYRPKDVALGLCLGSSTKAYPFPEMPDGAVVNDVVDGLPLVVVYDAPSRTAIPYARTVAGRVLTFYAVEPTGPLPVEFMDVETGSRWDLLGQALAGPLAGARLEQVPAYNSMWFAWAAYWADTEIWTGGGIIDAPPATAVTDGAAQVLPGQFVLGQNVPNPFNPATHIRYELPHAGRVRVTVFDAVGQRVRRLVDQVQARGAHRLAWDGLDGGGTPVGSGTYYYRLEMPDAGLARSRSMTLVR